MPALARGNKTFPVRDRQIDRRQRPRAQDRARDDDTRRGLLIDHQIGADREHRRLQGHAQHLGDGAETSGDVAGALIACQIILVGVAPAAGQAPGHSHRHHHLGVAPAGGGEIVAPRGEPGRLARGPARHVFGHEGKADQDDGADQRGQADQDVEGKTDRQIERQPGQIEESARSDAGEERADVVEVAQRLQALVAAADDQRQTHHGVEHPAVERFVQRGSDTPQHAAPDQIEDALEEVHAAGEDRQADQRRHAPARKYPVINLQHEQRAGQIEHVDHAADDADANEGAAAGAQRIAEFGTPDYRERLPLI